MSADARAADGEQTAELTVEPASENEGKKRRGFPSPFTILLIVMLLVWIATFFIPSGMYHVGEGGGPIAGSFHHIDVHLSFMDRIRLLLKSPVNGLYGIQSADTGVVWPFEVGWLFGGAQVFLFILAIGGFMTVVFSTGALDLGISHLAHRFKARGWVLIVGLSVLFGILGSVMSWSDETLGFYALMIPMMLSLGYDRMITVAVVTVAPFVGVIGSTVNPFRIGIGSDRAGVSIGEGLGLRIVLLILVMAAMILYTLRYARRVKADSAASIIGVSGADAQVAAEGASADLAPLTRRHKVIIGIVMFTFLLMTFSIIPWGTILHNTVQTMPYPIGDGYLHEVVEPFSWELGWWLPELTVLFVVMAIVVGLVGRLGESATVSAFVKGIADFSGPASLVLLAMAVSVILTNTKTIDTVLNTMEGVVSGTGHVPFILLLCLVSLPLGFLVGGGSAGMALVMPILAPLGDFAGVDRSLIVTAYNAITALLGLLLPTNALLVAGLALAKVGYNVYLRWVLPLIGILTLITVAVLLVGVAL